MGTGITTAMLDDWENSAFEPKVKGMLRFLQKWSRAPAELKPADVEMLRELGIRDEAVVDALYMCTMLQIMNRLANALGFEDWTPERYAQRAQLQVERGGDPPLGA